MSKPGPWESNPPPERRSATVTRLPRNTSRRNLLIAATCSLVGGAGTLAFVRFSGRLFGRATRHHEGWLTVSYPTDLADRVDTVVANVTEARADLRDWFGTDIGDLRVDIAEYANPSFGIGYMHLPEREVARGGRVRSIWHEIVHVAGAPGSIFGEGLAEDFQDRFAGDSRSPARHDNIGSAVAAFHRYGDYFLPSTLLDQEIGSSGRLEADTTRQLEYATASAFATYVISVAFPSRPARASAQHYLALARYDRLAPFQFPEEVQRQHLNGMTVAELEPGWYRHLRDRWNLSLPPKPEIADKI